MFKLFTLEHVVQIPPEKFGQLKELSAYEILSKEYQGIIDNELGFVISITDIVEIGPGKIIHGNGGTFHSVKFSVLTYNPVQFEIVEGEVVEIVDFGAFIRLGPSDGLCHLSQITDEKLTFQNVNQKFVGKDKNKVLEVGDLVRARVIAVSQGSGRGGKIGLTMRQPYLGKLEWIENELIKKNQEALNKGLGTASSEEEGDETPEKPKKKTTKKKSTKKK